MNLFFFVKEFLRPKDKQLWKKTGPLLCSFCIQFLRNASVQSKYI